MENSINDITAVVQTQSENIDKLAGAIGHLATAVDERPTKRGVLTTALLLNLVTIIITLSLFAFVYFDSKADNRNQSELLKANNRNGDLLIECTTPSTKTKKHPCYERGLEAQSTAVKAITDANGNGKLDNIEILEALNK